MLLACTERPLDTGTSATDTADPPASTGTSDPGTTGGATSSPTTTTTTTAPTTTAPDTTTTTGEPEGSEGGLPPFPDAPGSKECDVWIDDCPEGQKCMPVSLDGDSSWESLRCVPVVADPDTMYEPCSILGTGLDGLDTCEEHMMCWDWDKQTKVGHCVGLCTGTVEDPSCADLEAFCAVSGDGVLSLCLPRCNPLKQDCMDGELCIPHSGGGPDTFLCVLDASGPEGQVFDPCEFPNACDAGLFCANPALAAECDQNGFGCCLPFCDGSKPDDCPGAGQTCLPWFEDPQQAPEDLQNLGVCGLMQ